MDKTEFTDVVWGYYHKHGRDLPWRHAEPHDTFDPYKILVSEIMLQQTQAARVAPKYQQFIQLFPTVQQLAAAPLADVLRAWSGLGYNRRAKFLWQSGQMIVTEYAGMFPNDQTHLTKLPGVGVNTAGAILAYAYNSPAVFIETNIRTVFIHHFFTDQHKVDDAKILKLVALTLPEPTKIREWYWALMDYGVHIKTTYGNASRASKHYVKQSRFAGSKRQVRGQVMSILMAGPQSLGQLSLVIGDQRLISVLDDLQAEKLITKSGAKYSV